MFNRFEKKFACNLNDPFLMKTIINSKTIVAPLCPSICGCWRIFILNQQVFFHRFFFASFLHWLRISSFVYIQYHMYLVQIHEEVRIDNEQVRSFLPWDTTRHFFFTLMNIYIANTVVLLLSPPRTQHQSLDSHISNQLGMYQLMFEIASKVTIDSRWAKE
jgi:hypothetical protein